MTATDVLPLGALATLSSLAGPVLGVTGTSAGATDLQRDTASRLLILAKAAGADRLVHGCCTGVDEDLAALARALGAFQVIGLPGREKGSGRRSSFVNDIEYAVPRGRSPELARSRRIAEIADLLLALPHGPRPALRSGTWSTVRYAMKARTPVLVILPDGLLARPLPGPRPVGVVLEPSWTKADEERAKELRTAPVLNVEERAELSALPPPRDSRSRPDPPRPYWASVPPGGAPAASWRRLSPSGARARPRYPPWQRRRADW